MREIICPTGQRTRVLHILSDSMPQSVRFTADATNGQPELRGTVEVERSAWLFAGRTETAPLVADNAFRKGMFDTRYAVYVIPGQDTRITLRSRHFTSKWLFLALGAVLVLGIVAGLGGLMLGSGP